MADKNPLQKCLIFIILSINLMFIRAENGQISTKKTYVVHMDKSAMPSPYTNHLQWYSSKIDSVTDPKSQEEEGNRILYTYQTAFHGLAARLEKEAGVVAVIPETRYKLHTTRSPRFLGLERQESERVWAERVTDHDVIVGVLDTGIWPESESFNDTGMSPVPSTWRGACETGRGSLRRTCNRKIVDARVLATRLQQGRSIKRLNIDHQETKTVTGHTLQPQ